MELNYIISERDKQNKNNKYNNNILMEIYKEKENSSDSKCELNKNVNSINLITGRNNNKIKFNEHIEENYYQKKKKKKSNLKK
jgi:hypothetical protein